MNTITICKFDVLDAELLSFKLRVDTLVRIV